jgi:hypothetical protein
LSERVTVPSKRNRRTAIAAKEPATAHYSFPVYLVGRGMLQGEYNSSSFIAGLLLSVCGKIPEIGFPGYQTPGWDNPIPVHYFRSGPTGAPR